MKLSLHEQKVLDIISNHPEIIDNPKDRTRIAKIYNLTEKTLRNRIAELKKRGLLNNGESQLDSHNSTVLDLNIESLVKLLLNRKVFIIKWTCFITMIFVVYSLIATPFFKSKITLYPAGSLVESGNMMGNLQGIAESFGLGSNGNNQTFNIPDIVNSRKLKKSIILNKWNSKSFNNKVNLIQFWELDKPKFFNPKKWIKNALPFPKAAHDTLGAQIFDALERLNKSILIEEKVTGLIEVSVIMEEPTIASDIANYIAEFVKKFVAAEQKKEATRNKNFIYGHSKRLLEETIASLNLKSYLFFRFGKINTNFSVGHNTSIFDLEVSKAAKALAKHIDRKSGIIYPNFLTKLLSSLFYIIPLKAINKLGL